jgi:F-box protein 8
MGQQISSCKQCSPDNQDHLLPLESFPDLASLPPELAAQVLSHLDATDLCLASCVNERWWGLANIDPLWKQLCYKKWGTVSAYTSDYPLKNSYKKLYLVLDNGTLTFAADPHEGISYLVAMGVLEDRAEAIAEFIHHTTLLDWRNLERFLRERQDVLQVLVKLHGYDNMFLPDALRKFFSLIPAPNERGQHLETLLNLFSHQFIECNPSLDLGSDTIFVVCYSLILLSVDLTSPHVKNKMSKREFIRNLRQATPDVSSELLGHMYDNIYLSGHVATEYS